jgi:PAS domain S-box-containing protein
VGGRLVGLHRALPAVIAVSIVVVLGMVALRIGDAKLAAAEEDRVHTRVRQVEEIAPKVRIFQLGSDLDNMASVAGFTPGDPGVNEVALHRLGLSSPGDTPKVALLVSTGGGEVLAAEPRGAQLSFDPLGTTWSESVAGHRGVSPVFVHEGEAVTARLVPIGGSRPWAVAIIVLSTRDSLIQGLTEGLGSLNAEPGGITAVDRAGVAAFSWDPALIGTTVISRAELDRVPAGPATVWTTDADGAEVTRVAAAMPNGYTLVFEQQTERLYRDLRDAQVQRDRTLLGVLTGTLVGLIVFQWIRQRTARRAEQRLHTLLENSQDLAVVADGDGVLRFVSPAVDGLLGYRAREWQGRALTELCHPDEIGRLRALLAEPGVETLLNLRLAHADGSWRWFDIEASDQRAQRELRGILLTCHEVDERKALEDELSFRANHDPLTGLANRTQLSDRLAELGSDPTGMEALAFL